MQFGKMQVGKSHFAQDNEQPQEPLRNFPKDNWASTRVILYVVPPWSKDFEYVAFLHASMSATVCREEVLRC